MLVVVVEDLELFCKWFGGEASDGAEVEVGQIVAINAVTSASDVSLSRSGRLRTLERRL